MLRSTMLYLAGNQQVERMVHRSRITRPLVNRFVAGETLDTALAETRALNAKGMRTTLDLLGENVNEESEAIAAYHSYMELLDRIEETGVDSNISIKLTMLGLDISEASTFDRLERLVERAAEFDNFVRIDMEGSPYTEQTLDFARRIHDCYPDHTGVVLQSYLYRTDQDLEELIERRMRLRIVKGAYKEPESVAYPRKSDVDAAFNRHIERLLDIGNYPAIATHDEDTIRAAKAYALQKGIDRSRFEFQMLYGVRRDLQEQLTREGFNMRVYVPYGRSWYPYFVRRLAERPANLLFIARSMLKE